MIGRIWDGLECRLLCRSRKWERNGTMLLSRNRYNGRILAFPVDLTKRGASLMTMRLWAVVCCLSLVLFYSSTAQARNDQHMDIALDGDPGDGFFGLPGEFGSSGGAASSSFNTSTPTVHWSQLWLRAICMRSPALHFLVLRQSEKWSLLSGPTTSDNIIDGGHTE